METLCKQASFQAIKGSINLELGHENPFTVDYIHRCNAGNKSPHIVIVEDLDFILHGNVPLKILESRVTNLFAEGQKEYED